MASVLDQAHFKSEAAAYRWVEARVWPDGRVCPHCGVVDNSGALKGKSTRLGVYKCYEPECRKPFTVKVGTIFESSHIALHIWLQAMFLLASSKKGISSNQLSRTLGVTLKSAWFMSHRIREAMGNPGGVFGSGGGEVEADETYIGRVDGASIRKGMGHKQKVFALVDRASGNSRAFVIDGEMTLKKVLPILQANVSPDARLMTDEGRHFQPMRKHFAEHGTVNHGKGEYVSREDRSVHTNTIEGYFSVFKRGMRGVYQHCREKHLHRYLAEFDFRYSNRMRLGIDDQTRMASIVRGVIGKRLTYQTTRGRREATA